MDPELQAAVDSILNGGGSDVAAPSPDGGIMADTTGSSSWLDSILGTVSDVAGSAADIAGTYYGAQNAAANKQAQTAYMQSLATTNAVMSAQQQRQALYIAAGILVFVLMLRQTAQAR